MNQLTILTSSLIYFSLVLILAAVLSIKKHKSSIYNFWILTNSILTLAAVIKLLDLLNIKHPILDIIYFTMILTASLFIFISGWSFTSKFRPLISYIVFLLLVFTMSLSFHFGIDQVIVNKSVIIIYLACFLFFLIKLFQFSYNNRKPRTAIAFIFLFFTFISLLLQLFFKIEFKGLIVSAGLFLLSNTIFLSIFDDIKTDDKTKQYNKLFRELQIHEKIFNTIDYSVFLFNNEGLIIKANNQFFDMFSESPQNALGKDICEFINEFDRKKIKKTIKKIGLSSKPLERNIIWLEKKNGDTFLASIFFTPLKVKQRIIIGVIKDISISMMKNKQIKEYTQTLEERISSRTRELFEKNEQLLYKNKELIQTNQSKSIFFANVSHELRTPLVAVCGYIEMMLDGSMGQINEDMEKALMVSNSNLQRLNTFISNLLDLSRIEAFKEKINYQKIDLLNTVDQILLQFKAAAIKNSIDILNEIPKELPEIILDPRHIEQIMINLVSNSMKFTKKGYIKVQAEVRKNKKVYIIVSDTGIGIPDKNKKSIFNRFYQVERKEQTKFKGTGLGLAIVKEIVDLYHGNVEVSDNIKCGTVFSFHLPNYKISERKLENKILIISTNKQQIWFMKGVLEERNFSVESTSSGLKALDIINKNYFDIIFLDNILPDLESSEICQIIRERITTHTIPIYITTFPIDEDERNNLIFSGAKGIITKPFGQSAIERILHDELHI